MLRKTGRLIAAILFTAFSILSLTVACDNDIFGNNAPADITLSSTLMEYDTIAQIQGKNLQLEATVTLKGGGKSKEVEWETPSDSAAFKVQSTAGGILTFQIYRSGTYLISAHALYKGEHYKTAECVITINDALTHLWIHNVTDDSTFTADSASLYLTKGNSVELSPIYTPSGTSQQDVLWTIDNSSVATISEKSDHHAILTAKGAGTATIRLSGQDNTSIYRTLKLTVADSGADQKFGVSKVTLNPVSTSIEVGKSQDFTAVVYDGNSNVLTAGDVVFTLEGTDNAFQLSGQRGRSISVTAIKGGEGKLIASYTYEGQTVKAEASLSVTGDVRSIGTGTNTISLLKDEKKTLSVFYNPSDTVQKGFTATGYDSTKIAIESITDDSLTIYAKTLGSSTLTLKSIYDEDVTSVINVIVTESISKASRISSVGFENGTRYLTIEPAESDSGTSRYEEMELSAYIETKKDNGSTERNNADYKLAFESSDPSVLQIVQNGYSVSLLAKKPGTAVIKAKSVDNPEFYAECEVTVGGALKLLKADKESINITVDGTGEIVLAPVPANAVFNEPFVSVSTDAVSTSLKKQDGRYIATLRGLRIGSAVVTYSVDGVSMATTKATVATKESVSVRSLDFQGVSSSLYLKMDDDPKTFTVNPIDKNGAVVDKKIFATAETASGERIAPITRVGESNTFIVSPANAGSCSWIFYAEGVSGVQSVMKIEVGGQAVQGDDVKSIKAPFDALSLSLKEGESSEETIQIDTIPLGLEEKAGKLHWSVSNADVARIETLTADGYRAKIVAKGEGSATLTAAAENGMSAKISLRVYGKNTASDTTISKASISGSGSKGYAIYNSIGETFTLTASAYHSDGTAEAGEEFIWAYEGDGIKSLLTENDGLITGENASVSFRTVKIGSYDTPSKVIARSVKNPQVTATYLVYVVTGEPTEDEPIAFAEYSGVTLEKGAGMDIGYSIYPVTYDQSSLLITSTSSAISASLDTDQKKIRVNATDSGSATLTVTDGKISFSVRVTAVEKAEKKDSAITSLTLDRTYLSYDLADKRLQTITASVYRDGKAESSEGIEWVSSDDEVVKVSASGNRANVIPGDKTGTAFITAISRNNSEVSASCSVEVIDSREHDQSLRYIMLQETSIRLSVGSVYELKVTGQPSALLADEILLWTTSDRAIATVTDGKVTALSSGEADITVRTQSGLSSTCHVTVLRDEKTVSTPSSIKLSDSIIYISQEEMDQTYSIYATIYDQNGEEMHSGSVLWHLNDMAESLEAVKQNLAITFRPKNAGTATITASSGNIKAEAKVIVAGGKSADRSLKAITLSPQAITMKKGETYRFRATTVPTDAEGGVLWSSSSTDLVINAVEGSDGRSADVSAKSSGVYKITASGSANVAISSTSTVTVKDEVKEDEITAVTLDVRDIVLDVAEKSLTAIKATVYKGGKAGDGEVEWILDDSLDGVIAIRETGGNTLAIEKKAVGEGYIKAVSKDRKSAYALCHVSVIDSSEIKIDTIQSAVLSSSSLSIEKGKTYRFSAKIYPETVKADISWSSSDESVATIDSSTGLAEAVGEGRALITALIRDGKNTLSRTCTLSVYSREEGTARAQRIAFSEKVVYLSQDKMDETKSVSATIYATDGSVMSSDAAGAEAKVSWSIENDAVAKLEWADNTALLTPRGAGTARVYASYQGALNSFIVVTGEATKASSVKASGISFSRSSMKMKKGESQMVTAYALPSGANAEFAFSISDGEVAEAVYSGSKVTIKALKAGTAILKAVLADDPSVSESLIITVENSTEGKVTAVVLDKNYLALELGTKDLTTVSATAYIDGKASKNVPLEWTLEGLTADQIGWTRIDSYSTVALTKKKAGEGYLVCSSQSDPAIYAKCRIEISEKSEEAVIAKRIELSSNLMQISQEKMDSTFAIDATVYGSDGKVMADEIIAWTVEDGNAGVLEVQKSRNSIFFSPRNAGTAIITATDGNVKSEAKVIVGADAEDETLKSYIISPSKLTLEEGGSAELSLFSVPSGAGTSAYWATDNPAVATIKEENGKWVVRAVAAGSANITASDLSYPSVSALSKITVKAKGSVASDEVTGITLDKSEIVLDMAEKNLTVLRATVYKNGKAGSGEVEWALDETLRYAVKTALMGRSSIGMTKVQVGDGYITASSKDDPSFFAKCHVSVIDSAATTKKSIRDASISSSSITLKKGDEHQYSVSVIPEDIEYAVSWKSSDETIVKVDERGLVRALKAGKVTITATVVYGDDIRYLTSTVNAYEDIGSSAPAFITLSDNTLYLSQENPEKASKVTATVLDSNRAELLGERVEWSAENDKVIRVETSGTSAFAYPLSAGSTLLRATAGNAENSVLVIVGAAAKASEKTASAIVFNPSSAIIEKNGVMEVSAEAVPAGIKGEELTFSVSNPSVIKAEVLADGKTVKVTGLAVGTSSLQARSKTNPAVTSSMTFNVRGTAENTVTAIELDKTYIALEIADKAITTLKATAYVNGKADSSVPLSWELEGMTADDISLTPANDTGSIVYITKKKECSGYVVAKASNGIYAKCRVEVVKAAEISYPISRISLSDNIIKLSQEKMDEVAEISAEIFDTNGDTVRESVTWSLSDDSVAKLTTSGNKAYLSPLSAGHATLRAKAGSIENMAYIQVGAAEDADDLRSIYPYPSKLILKVGKSYDIEAFTVPAAYSGEVIWSLDSGETAEITARANAGRKITVKGLRAGTATLTAASKDRPDIKASVNVTVTAEEATSGVTAITLDKASVYLDMADKAITTIKATVDIDGMASSSAVTWTLDESLKATVGYEEIGNNTIALTKKAIGSGYITATSIEDPSFQAKAYVEVVDTSTSAAVLRFITLSDSYIVLEEGDLAYITATGYEAEAFKNASLTWSTDNPDVAVVAGGKVRAIKSGDAMITATVNGTSIKETCRVTVKSPESAIEPKMIVLSEDAITLSRGESHQLTSEIVPAGTKASLMWSTSDNAVATVSSTGKVSAKGTGSAVITAYNTSYSLMASCRVTVKDPVADPESLKAIIFSPASATVAKGGTVTLRAYGYPESAGDDFEYSIDNESVARIVNASNGTVKAEGIGYGNAKITAISLKSPAIKTAASLTVVKPGESGDRGVTSIVISDPVSTLYKGTKTAFEAAAYEGTSKSEETITWSLEGFQNGDALIINADSDGKRIYLDAKEKGEGYLVASAENGTYSKTYISIIEKSTATDQADSSVSRIVISGEKIIQLLQSSSGVKVTASVIDTEGDVTEDKVTWMSSDEKIASVYASGNMALIVPASAGQTEVRASFGGKSESVLVIVGAIDTDKSVTAIRIEPEKLTLEEGNSWEMSAYTVPAGKRAALIWTTSSPSVLSITQSGTDGTRAIAEAKSAGYATVVAYSADNIALRSEANVTVKALGTIEEDEITAITLDKKSLSLALGSDSAVPLTATVYKGGKASAEEVEWTEDGLGIYSASPAADGRTVSIKAEKAGTGFIIASSRSNPEFKATATVEVSEKAVSGTSIERVEVMPGSVTLKKTGEVKLSLSVFPSDIRGYKVTWKSSNSSVAEVTEEGILKAKGAGNTRVTALVEYNGNVYEAYADVSVESDAIELQRIELSDKAITLRVSETYQVATSLIPSGASAEITWATSDSDIARVDQRGVITATGKGSALIAAHAYDENKEATIAVTVVESEGAVTPSFIRLSSQQVTLSQKRPDEEKIITASVIATDGYPIAGAVVSWTMDDESIAKKEIDGNSARLKSGDAGKTALRAWYGTLSSSATIYTGITPDSVITLDHLSISPASMTIKTGSSAVFSAKPYPAGLSITPSWESADASIASIDEDAKSLESATVIGVREGKTTITAKDAGTDMKTTASVRVLDDISEAVTAITLDKRAISFDLAEKSMATATAKVYVSNTLSETEPIEWKLLTEDLESKSDIVTFVSTDASMRTVALRPREGASTGRAYLRATALNDSDMYAQLFIELTDSSTEKVKVTELRCEMDSATLIKGTTRIFRTLIYPEGLKADVRWKVTEEEPKSGSGNVITVDAYGKVTAVSEGTATLKAYVYGTAPEVSDTILINVTADGKETASEYDIGTITITPSRLTLKQDADFPTSITATVYDRSGNVLSGEMVDWDLDAASAILNETRREGNTIYVEGKSAGKGSITASKRSRDGSLITATAFITTGAVISSDETALSDMYFPTSSPVYLVAGDGKEVTSRLEYVPSSKAKEGAVWTALDATGYISYKTTATSITATGLNATPNGKNPVVTAVSVSKDESGNSLSRSIEYKVAATRKELPEVTALTLDKTALVFSLSDKATAAVTATAFDYDGNVVPGAKIEWAIRNNTTTNVTITETSGASTGVNRGTMTGQAELVATCGSVEAVCSIRVIDSTAFEGIATSAETIRLIEGAETTIKVYGNPDSLFEGALCTKSGDVDAVEVIADASGKSFRVRALSAGTAYLQFSAEVDGNIYTADTAVYVNETETLGVDRITLSPLSAYIPVGGKTELAASLYDKRGNKVEESITYRSDDPSVASVKAVNGGVEVTALKKGATAIYAYAANVSASAYIMAGENAEEQTELKAIIPDITKFEMSIGQVEKITLATVPSGYKLTNLQAVSSNRMVAKAEILNGYVKVTALGEGDAMILVSEGAVSTVIRVTVKGVAKPASIAFDQTSVTLRQTKDDTATVRAYVYDENKTLLSAVISLWQTSDITVAKIKASDAESVTIVPVNAGSATITASSGAVSSSFRVSVNEVSKEATEPSAIKASTPNVTLTVGDTQEVEVLYEPSNLSADAKELSWTSGDDTVASVRTLGKGKAAITGLSIGKTAVKAESRAGASSDRPSTIFSVNVKAEDDRDVYRIELDKNQVRLGFSEETVITAKLYRNNIEVDASGISWTLEGTKPAAKAGYVTEDAVTDTARGADALLRTKASAGYVYAVASYGSTVARAQIEVTDLSKQSTGLSSVVISTRKMIMEEGEMATFEATTIPQIAGLTYRWTATPVSSDPGEIEFVSAEGAKVTLRAKKKGAMKISVQAEYPGYCSVSATSDLRIEEAGALDKTYRYSALKLDKTSVSMSPDGSYVTVTATLLDEEGKEISGTISSWALLDSRGREIFTTDGDTYEMNGVLYSSFSEMKRDAEQNGDTFALAAFSIIGGDNSIASATPALPGIFFLEARGPVENGGYVASRMMLDISGRISSVGFPSTFLHIIKGESVTEAVSASPSGAIIKTFSWQEDTAENGGISILAISDIAEKSAQIKGMDIGKTEVEYTAADISGAVHTARMKVQVHDPSYGTGGIRNIGFSSVYPTASYPYATDTYKASAYYMDGTAAEDSDISYRLCNMDGTTATDGRVLEKAVAESKDAKVIATYTVTSEGVRITPFAKGSVKVIATLDKDGTEYTSEMYLTIPGSSSSLTPSSSSIVLYTGGSAKIEMSTDNGVNSSYDLELIEEYAADGHRILNGTLEGTEEKMQSVFSDTLRSYSASTSVVIGTKALVTNQMIEKGTGIDADRYLTMQAGGTNGTITRDEQNRILATFPRTASFRVTTGDKQSTAVINVTVNQLPGGNTYPIALTLDQDKVDLTPPFSAEESIKASLTDSSSQETQGTLSWYYYPVGTAPTDAHKLLTNTVSDRDDIRTYFSADGKTMYYTPKLSGLYRLKAECVQNPQLSSIATINVGGSVSGVSADTGTSVEIEKGKSQMISAVFSPSGALARSAWFSIDEKRDYKKSDGTISSSSYSRVISDTRFDNSYISVTVNSTAEGGDTATVYGKLSTGNDNRQLLRIIYPQTTIGESLFKETLDSDPNVLWKLSGTTLTAFTPDASGALEEKRDSNNQKITVEVFAYAVSIDVYANKTIYSFKASGATEVNPNEVSGSVLTYSVSASSSSSSSSSGDFSSWDWVEAKLVGADSGMVYASSVPVDSLGHSLYQASSDGVMAVGEEKENTIEVKKGLYYPEPTFCSTATAGITASDVKNYNSSKTVMRFFEGSSVNLPGDADKTSYVRSDSDLTSYELLSGEALSYTAVYDVNQDDDGYYVTKFSERKSVGNGTGSELNGRLAKVVAPAPLSDLEGGRLLSSDNNQTYKLTLNANAIPTEPLIFKAGLSELVAEGNKESQKYYDEETAGFRDSDTSVFIGGKIQSLSPGTSELKNNGAAGTTTADGSLIQLIEGASAIIKLSYNPTYTHQREVKWEIIGGATGSSSYTITPSKDTTELSFVANKIASGKDQETVNIRATSVYNANVYCDFTVVIQCIVKNITFTAKALTQTNKSDRGSEPIYKLISDPASYPDQNTIDKVDCYDYADVAGDSALVDAYLIEMVPQPKFGYDFTAEIKTGASIGSLSTSSLDSSSNSFRFVPKGRVYDSYDENGNPASSSYEVEYGDVVVKVSCSDLNYSKDFTISYGAAAGRLVKEISEPHRNRNWMQWDAVTKDGKNYLYGIEAIVMHEGEEFPVTMIDFNNGTSSEDFFQHWRDDGFDPVMMWYTNDGFGNICYDGVNYYSDVYGTAPAGGASKWIGGLSFTTGGDNVGTYLDPKDPRITEDMSDEEKESITGGRKGMYGTVCTLKAEKQGIYSLGYSLIKVLRDSDGNMIYDTFGKPSYIVTKGQIPVYVITEADQSLLAALDYLTKGTTQSATELISKKISRTNLDKWFMPAKDTAASGSSTESASASLYRGKTFLAFDETHNYGTAVYNGIAETDFSAKRALDFTRIDSSAFQSCYDLSAVLNLSGREVMVEGSETDTSCGDIPLTRTFKALSFESLTLAGENGIAKLRGTGTFVIGRSDDAAQGEWVANNIDGDRILDFSSENISSITIKNLSLRDVNAIKLRKSVDLATGDYLSSFSIENVTYPAGVFLDGDRSWSDSSTKLINELSFDNMLINSIELKNFTNLKKLSIATNGTVGADNSSGGEYASSRLMLDTLSDGTDESGNIIPVELSLSPSGCMMLFRTIELRNSTFRNLSLDGKIDNTLYITMQNIKAINNLSVSGKSLLKITAENIAVKDKSGYSGGVASFLSGASRTAEPVLSVSGMMAKTLNISASETGSAEEPSGFSKITVDGKGFDSTGTFGAISNINIDATGASKTAEITVKNISLSDEAVAGKGIPLSVTGHSAVKTITISDIPALGSVNLSETGFSGTTLTIKGCGSASTAGISMTGQDRKLRYIEIGNSDENRTKLGSPTLKSGTVKIYGTDASSITLDADTFIAGNKLAENSYGEPLAVTGEVKLNETKTSISNITLYGAAKGYTSIGTLDFSQKTVGSIYAENEKHIDVRSFNLNKSMLDETSFRMAIKTVSDLSDSNSLDVTNAFIRTASNSLYISGGTVYVTKTVTEQVSETETIAYYTELLSIAQSASEKAKAEKEAKAQHSLLCYDSFQQDAVSSYTLSGCTSACRNLEENGVKLHYHAPSNIVILMEELTSTLDKKSGKMIESGTTMALEKMDERKEYYMPSSKLQSFTEILTDENGNATGETGRTSYQYLYTSGVIIEHLGASINGKNDESLQHVDGKHNDGCVIKMTFRDGTSAYIEQMAMDIETESAIQSGAITMDAAHEPGLYAPLHTDTNGREVDSIDSSTDESGMIVYVRRCQIGAYDSSSEKIAVHQYLRSNMFFKEYPATDASDVDTSIIETETDTKITYVTKTLPNQKESVAADDRCPKLILDDVKFMKSESAEWTGISLYVALDRLKWLSANTSGNQTDTNKGYRNINIQGRSLEHLEMLGSPALGISGFTIGSMNYHPTKNNVGIDEMDYSYDGQGIAYFLGMNLNSCNRSAVWSEWLPKLSYLDMRYCNVKFYGEASGDGHENDNYYVQVGSAVTDQNESSDRLGSGYTLIYYKKWKGDGWCASDSEGSISINGTLAYICHTKSWRTWRIKLDKEHKKIFGEDGIYSTGEVLLGKKLTIRIHDQNTSHYGHDYCFVMWPWGAQGDFSGKDR